MTRLQELRKEKKYIEHQMFLCKPLRGYLGNQYNYWASEREKVELKIENLRNEKYNHSRPQ